MIKKILGIIMVSFGFILSLAILNSFLKIFTANSEESNNFAFKFGQIIGILFLTWLDYLIIKTGLKFIKFKKEQMKIERDINNIGEE